MSIPLAALYPVLLENLRVGVLPSLPPYKEIADPADVFDDSELVRWDAPFKFHKDTVVLPLGYAQSCQNNYMPFAWSYLKGVILDSHLPNPIAHWSDFPTNWTTLPPYQTTDGFAWYFANSVIPACYPFFYYEVRLAGKVNRSARITIGMNMASQAYAPSIPDYAVTFAAGSLSCFEPSVLGHMKSGDILGFGISRADGRMFCTKNGRLMGDSCGDPGISKKSLYPIISLSLFRGNTHAFTHNADITFNFGHREFAFAIDQYLETFYYDPRQARFRRSATLLPDALIKRISLLSVNVGGPEMKLNFALVCRQWAKIHLPTPLYDAIAKMRFERSAKLLPDEILHMIAMFAAEASKDESKTLCKLAMVCHEWASICRPGLFASVDITDMAALDRLRLLFEASESLHYPHCMWRRALEPLPSQTRAPTFALSVASLHKNLAQAREVGIDPRLDGPAVQEAPPRIEAAVSALLRPLQNLQRLDIRGVKFKTLTQFLRMVRAAPQISSIYLEQVSILQAPARLHWPPTAVLSSLKRFSIFYCSIPIRSLPALLSLAFCGQPDTAFLRNVHRPGEGLLQRDDANALVSIAEAAVGMYNILARDEHDEQCSVSLREPPTDTSAGQMLSVEFAGCSVELYMKKTEAGRPKAPALASISVTLSARVDRSAAETASLFAFLDMRLHEISGDAQPRLRFSCFIDVEGELSRSIFPQLPDIMPRLSAEDRVLFEEDDDDLVQSLNASTEDTHVRNADDQGQTSRDSKIAGSLKPIELYM